MCVFCEIIAGNIPGKKVYEDDTVLAILDISQAGKGHTLVMPKQHYKNILECPEDTLQHIILVVQKLTKQITINLQADGCNVLNNCNEAAGQSVDHLHFHIIPRFKGDDLKIEFTEHSYDLDEILAQIKK